MGKEKVKINEFGFHELIDKPTEKELHKYYEEKYFQITSPSEIIYFGDNPAKDFRGIKPLGFKTIRLLRGNYADICPDKSNNAHHSFNSFDEISTTFLKTFVNE